MTWFPSLRTSILILLTIILEVGFIIAACMCLGLSSNITHILVLVVILGNLITGAIGWLVYMLWNRSD